MASISASTPAATPSVVATTTTTTKQRSIIMADSSAATTTSQSTPLPDAASPLPSTGATENISYSAERIIGNGSFGVVFEAKVVETGEVVAIKKVLQDKRFKNRELQIMRQLVKDPHPNIVALKHCFYSQVRCLCARPYRSSLIYPHRSLTHIAIYITIAYREKSQMNSISILFSSLFQKLSTRLVGGIRNTRPHFPYCVSSSTSINSQEHWPTFTFSAFVIATLNPRIY
jgi:hypothetical protein